MIFHLGGDYVPWPHIVPKSNPANILILCYIYFSNLNFGPLLTVSNQCYVNLPNMASAMAAIISSAVVKLNLSKLLFSQNL